MENWKPVVGYEDLYHVSDTGLVKRLKGYRSRADRILRPGMMTVGYLFVALCKNGIPRPHSIHRLVAAAFIGPCPESHEVNHKNYNRLDNNIGNIEYLTKADNVRHGRLNIKKHTSLRGTMVPNAIMNEAIVKEIRQRRSVGESYSQIAVAMNLKKHNVASVASGKQWKWVQ